MNNYILYLDKEQYEHLFMLMGKDVKWQKMHQTGKEALSRSILTQLKKCDINQEQLPLGKDENS